MSNEPPAASPAGVLRDVVARIVRAEDALEVGEGDFGLEILRQLELDLVGLLETAA